MISFAESCARLQACDCPPSGREHISLGQALGRILAETIVASADEPAHATAALDGYAIRGEAQSLQALKILGEDNPAGGATAPAVTPGHAVKTFTGAVMPEGTDTLIPIENVTADAGTLQIDTPVPTGFGVRLPGESYVRGETLITQGTRIGYAQIGVLAGLGISMVPVAVKPRVAVLATGSELLELGDCPERPSQIRSTNHHTLAALAEQSGADVIRSGIIDDRREAILAAFESALRHADLVVSTGGVSVGDYDFVKEIIPALGAEVIFQGVLIKPGQHVMLAQREGRFLLGLPGFAYSSTVTFILYALPLIKRMQGRDGTLIFRDVPLREPFRKRTGKTAFTACNLTAEGVDFQGKKSGTSAILINMLQDAALLRSEAETAQIDAGERVRVLQISDNL